MVKIADYFEYRKHKPEYKLWKQKREEQTAKKLEYIKQNPISDKQKEEDLKRAKIVLNAVNIMDEYSQSRAEDMEIYIQGVLRPISETLANASTVLAMGMIALSKSTQKAIEDMFKGNFKKAYKLIPPLVVFITPAIAFSLIASFWGAKKEIEASRNGRKDAIKDDLNSLNQFAVLTDEQEKEVNEIAKTIKVSNKEKRRRVSATKGIGLLDSIKTIFSKNNEAPSFLNKKQKLDAKLTEKEILEAKKDKELIQNIIEKIDIASQDYAENAELTTNVVTTFAFAGGGLSAILTGKLINLLRISPKISVIAQNVVMFGIVFLAEIFSTKIEKQASRVGRFKAKNEFLNNPEQLFYVDEEKYKNTIINEVKPDKKSYIKTFIQLIKDNKEYNKYIKEHNVADIQKRKAKDKIKITPEQSQRAKQLQDNVFNMFNTLDDKSQIYSESTEAFGQFINEIVSFFVFLPAIITTAMSEINKSIKTDKMYGKSFYFKLFASCLIPIAMNAIVTKEQKNASRVAHMQTIKELDDFRYFASKSSQNTKENKAMSPALKSLLNKTI